MNVLITDAENKNALAAVRSLGCRGARVITGSSRRLARSFCSRYSDARVYYPAPEREDEFVDRLIELVGTYRLDVILPIGDVTNRVCSKHLNRLGPHVQVPVAPWPAMEIASSKRLTMPYAAAVGVDVPHTYAGKSEVKSFPVVVKRSAGTGAVRYVNGPAELESIDSDDSIIQEWVPGEGFGFFALFDHGRERATFMHRRLREYPITGGASAAAESFYDPRLAAAGLALLRALEWHGVAMVEFKRDIRDGRYKLMEINPKFWGSLDLSIAAGVDFPWLAALLAMNQLDGASPQYHTGVRFRWVFDDLLHLAARPASWKDVVRDFVDSDVKSDVWRTDPMPAIFDAVKTIALITSRALSGRLRHPHGAVKPSKAAPHSAVFMDGSR